ncbi:MAG: mannitol dehydrogenase family protein [Planctomycetota bacterium]|jgi:D-arabinitol 4-dehydrogenase|nr:mannitol dehydrogenase family protein [Planctomycetota bacterium]
MSGEAKTWLHVGAGSFHRAHQAWYLNRLIRAGDADWSIALGNIRDDVTPTLEKLARQGHRYTLETVDPAGGREYELITSIKATLPWDADLTALVARGASPETRVIAFTVTEAGYYLDTKLRLDRGNPDLRADLAGAKTTVYGAMAAILRRRLSLGGAPVTLLSCDNVRHNGERFRNGFLEFLELRGEKDLSAWIADGVSCPSCMVDRITPRPGPDIAGRVLARTGFADLAPVMSESFVQWVIEDRFAAGRPALEKVGVEMVADVAPYEEAKIRILNASHSCIAWAGTLAGMSYIHEGALTPAIRDLAWDYVTRDVIPCLTPSPLDLAAYRDTTLARFGNPNILDTNQRVAADGFSKIPAMVGPTLVERYAAGAEPAAAAMLPALFFLFLAKWRENKLPYAYRDGAMDADKTRALLDSADPLGAFAADARLFGQLAGKAEFAALLRRSVARAKAWLAGEG